VPAGAWAAIGAAIVVAIVVLALLLARRRRAERAVAWRRRAGSTVDQLDNLAVHLGSADPSTLGNLAPRDAPRLAALAAELQRLRGEAPKGVPTDDLNRLAAAAGSLQTVLLSAQFPDRGQAAAGDVQRTAAEVNGAAATARAGLTSGASPT
jgi:hypothetical protein